MESKKAENVEEPEKKPLKRKFDKKAEVNNEIIRFQGKFKQAKVGVIRKLVQKLKHPEKKPKQNLAAKAERYTQVLNQLKHTSPKRLGVLALIYYESGKRYLSDPNSTIEQLAVGYFTEHKGVSDILDAILKKLQLTEIPYWKKLIKKLFKTKDKDDVKAKADKAQKKNSFNETDHSEKVAKSKDKKVKQRTEQAVTKQSDSEKESITHINTKPIDSKESDSSNESDDDSSDEIAEHPTAVDDFFITADGSNYLSTAIANKTQGNDSDDDSNQKKVYEKKPRESSFFHKSDKKPEKSGSNRFEGAKRKWPNESDESVHKAKETKIDPELHPSWQAKQKQKPTITAFKGTKITFD